MTLTREARRTALPAWLIASSVLGWITAVLVADRLLFSPAMPAPGALVGAPSATLPSATLPSAQLLAHNPLWQLVLGAGTWALLVWLLWRADPLTRARTVVVIGFASVVEYVFSPGLGVYTYRLHELLVDPSSSAAPPAWLLPVFLVPSFVPPGHGLVYLAAAALGRTRVVAARLSVVAPLVLGAVGVWAGLGLLGWPRRDVLGAFWFGCLLWFVWRGRRDSLVVGLWVGLAVVVSWLEIAGVSNGVWAWNTVDPTGWIPIGNPPSGAAGGYGWFDAAAIAAAPGLVALASATRARWRGGAPQHRDQLSSVSGHG